MRSKTEIVCAVEIGTSQVTVLVGEIAQNHDLRIIGIGECASSGVVKGAITDFRAASDATHHALLAAEKTAGMRIKSVFLAQSGGHVDGFYNEAAVNVSAVDGRVRAKDVDAVCNIAKSKDIPEGCIVIHHIRRPYRLDGRLVPDPINLTGKRLEVGYWTTYGRETLVASQIHVILGFHVRVTELILSGLASGMALTTPDERKHGVLVIDIGAGTTDYALYRDGCAQTAGVIPVAGSHLTNDLSLALHLNTDQAEKIKRLYGRGQVVTQDRTIKIWANDRPTIGDHPLSRRSIEQVTNARTQEIFEVVRKKLGAYFDPDKIPSGVILTGGTSLLPEIDKKAAQVFELPVNIAKGSALVNENLRGPHYSTTLGMLSYPRINSGAS